MVHQQLFVVCKQGTEALCHGDLAVCQCAISYSVQTETGTSGQNQFASAVQHHHKLVGKAVPVQAYKLACFGDSVLVVDHVPAHPIPCVVM